MGLSNFLVFLDYYDILKVNINPNIWSWSTSKCIAIISCHPHDSPRACPPLDNEEGHKAKVLYSRWLLILYKDVWRVYFWKPVISSPGFLQHVASALNTSLFALHRILGLRVHFSTRNNFQYHVPYTSLSNYIPRLCILHWKKILSNIYYHTGP